MADVRYLRRRGANITVQVNGEVLFAPGTDLWKWRNRFSSKVKTATLAAAPVNKRPRWAHYGPMLKSQRSIIADTKTRIVNGGGFFYIMVGSTVAHAYYVDQGTGIYAGNGSYEAKILPPLRRGSPSLFERTWTPPGAQRMSTTGIWIKGQKGQFFFDRGLRNGFRAMRMRSFQVPGDGGSNISSALKSVPNGMEGFLGNTPADAGFRASLREWRAWRDAAFNAGFALGDGPKRPRVRVSRARDGAGTKYRTRRTPAQNERRAQMSKERSQRYRDAASDLKKQSTASNRKAQAVAFNERSRAEKRRFLAAVRKKGSVVPGSVEFVNGRWTAKVFVKGTGGVSRAKEFTGKLVV